MQNFALFWSEIQYFSISLPLTVKICYFWILKNIFFSNFSLKSKNMLHFLNKSATFRNFLTKSKIFVQCGTKFVPPYKKFALFWTKSKVCILFSKKNFTSLHNIALFWTEMQYFAFNCKILQFLNCYKWFIINSKMLHFFELWLSIWPILYTIKCKILHLLHLSAFLHNLE